jgi:hyperosmotically inducible periplasmic protein
VEQGGKRLQTRERSEMNIQRIFLTTALCVASVITAVSGKAQTPDSPKPDSTSVNKRDRDADQATADQQKNNRPDRELTKDIRRSIMADKSLSSYAHNIKIITQNGTVTLKGPVKSEDEKRSVVAKAVAVAGSPDKVTNQVSVKH